MNEGVSDDRPMLGHMWLRAAFAPQSPPPYVESYLVAGARRTEVIAGRIVEFYPRSYATGDDVIANLRFALRYEPLDLGVLAATFVAIDAEVVAAWVRTEPSGSYARRAWFFYEYLTGERLEVPDAAAGNYVEALDAQKHVAGARRNSSRHRVIDNLLGTPNLCPTVRRTAKLEGQIGVHIDAEAREIIIEPVVAAAVAAFAFVFIHPFEDGNGRIHRFIVHHVLSKTGFSPGSIIFPVSAAIVRDQRSYDAVLESFSRPLLSAIEWGWTSECEIAVRSDSAPLYRFFDATTVAEYLYDRVVETVRTDLREELGFLVMFDRAMEGIRAIVDMPDRRAALLIRLMLQNGGRLSKSKRGQFDELTDAEIAAMEQAVQTVSGHALSDATHR